MRGRPSLLHGPSEAHEVRLKSKHVEAADGNLTLFIERALDAYLEHEPSVRAVLDERDQLRKSSKWLEDHVRKLKDALKFYQVQVKELANLKRSIRQSIRVAVGESKADSMGLYRRCLDAMVQAEDRVREIDERLFQIRTAQVMK